VFHRPCGGGPQLGRQYRRRRPLLTTGKADVAQARGRRELTLGFYSKEIQMPVIAWLLGVPLSIVLLLMLFGVF
jgi:hypothetical protein